MMTPELQTHIEKIFHRQKNDFRYDWRQDRENTDLRIRARLEAELSGFGPLAALLGEHGVQEILVNGPDQIYYEKEGRLYPHPDRFFSDLTFAAALDRLAQACGTYLNREKPFLECQWKNLRVTLIYSEIARGQPLLCIRRQPETRWTLARLHETGWCTGTQLALTRHILAERQGFLVAGGTGSGKTSFLQALLEELPPLERAVLLEDTQELHPPNAVSVSLLTRHDPAGQVSEVTLEDLLKRALRLRPDRLVVGEIRGAEAKALLLALSTGHDGSFGSLHAGGATEALLRLEMLIQMGAPQWNLHAIRRLIRLGIRYLFILHKEGGRRTLRGIYELNSVEEQGLTLTCLEGEEDH